MSIDAEEFKRGFRAGFAAGQEAAIREAGPLLVRAPRSRAPRVSTPKCACGHAASTHNDLGYCQARGKRYSDGCHCDGFDDRLSVAAVETPKNGETK